MNRDGACSSSARDHCVHGAAVAARMVRRPIYAESFRQGLDSDHRGSFEAKLSPENATYRERIKDSRGNDRYELTITPQRPGGRQPDHFLAG